jgi:hypothetical protein
MARSGKEKIVYDFNPSFYFLAWFSKNKNTFQKIKSIRT